MAYRLVSVVMPSFNQAQFIRESIMSVLDQDYPALELIVMDGGSTDGTLDVLESIRDARLTWVSEKDKGQTDAINKGMRRAKGEILTYLNSDDLLLPGAVRFTAEYFEAHPDISVIFSDANLIQGDGAVYSDFRARPYTLVSAITGGQPNPQQGTFWRRAVMERIGLFDEALHYCLDYDYWIRMALAGYEIRYVPGFRGAFRLHATSKSVSQAFKFENEMRIVINRVFAEPTLAPDVRAVREEAELYLDWRMLKHYYVQGKRSEALPLTGRFIRGKRNGRRVLATAIAVDCVLHTSFAALLDKLVFRLNRGKLLPD